MAAMLPVRLVPAVVTKAFFSAIRDELLQRTNDVVWVIIMN